MGLSTSTLKVGTQCLLVTETIDALTIEDKRIDFLCGGNWISTGTLTYKEAAETTSHFQHFNKVASIDGTITTMYRLDRVCRLDARGSDNKYAIYCSGGGYVPITVSAETYERMLEWQQQHAMSTWLSYLLWR